MGKQGLTVNAVQPHDLVRLSDIDSLALADAPAWVRDTLSTTPWVVVRRSPPTPGLVAVGVRGSNRARRHALNIPFHHVDAIVPPEELVDRAPPRDMPAFRALTSLRSRIGSADLRWGPAGSAGFELATGAVTVTESSDLDLIVRVDSSAAGRLRQLESLHAEFTMAAVRVDCQVQMPFGAVALSELLGTGTQVLVRSATGPRLASRRDLVA
jgi:phosphoribosyl-dephospho-CoA transferase